MSVMRLGYVHIRVTDLEEAALHYTKTRGMQEIAAVGNRRYFKGWDEFDHHSVVIEEGAVGLVKFGMKVSSPDDLDRYEKNLTAFGVTTERMATGESYAVGEGLRVSLPTGQTMEPYADMEYLGTEVGSFNPQSVVRDPRGLMVPRLDHMQIAGEDPLFTERMCKERLGFHVSERLITDIARGPGPAGTGPAGRVRRGVAGEGQTPVAANQAPLPPTVPLATNTIGATHGEGRATLPSNVALPVAEAGKGSVETFTVDVPVLAGSVVRQLTVALKLAIGFVPVDVSTRPVTATSILPFAFSSTLPDAIDQERPPPGMPRMALAAPTKFPDTPTRTSDSSTVGTCGRPADALEADATSVPAPVSATAAMATTNFFMDGSSRSMTGAGAGPVRCTVETYGGGRSADCGRHTD
jgi:catechol 2,3-dioxygenase-like lactoylglutathione lyase family enzyme